MKKSKLLISTLLLISILFIGCDKRTPEEKADYYTAKSEIHHGMILILIVQLHRISE